MLNWVVKNRLTTSGHNEQRFKTLGMGPKLNILFVVHAERSEDTIRIISARKADRNETKQYYQGIGL